MIRIIANGTELQPVERDTLGFKSTFGKRPNELHFSNETLTFVKEDFEMIMNHITNNSRFVTIPLTVEAENNFVEQYVLNLRGSVRTNHSISVGIIPRKGNLDFFTKADSTSFELINSENGFAPSTIVDVPYLVVPTDIVMQSIMIAYMLYSLTMELVRVIKDTGMAVASGAIGFTAPIAILQLAIVVVYVASLILSIVYFVNQLVKLYFPRLRYLKAMSDYDLIRQGCAYLGYTFESDLMTSLKKLHTLPVPMTRNANRGSIFQLIPDDLFNQYFNYGFPTAQDTVVTLGDLISSIETIFNAETVVYNGVVRIETRTTFMTAPVATIPFNLNDQENSNMKIGFDEENVWKRKLLSWQIDPSDAHTTDSFVGLASEKQEDVISVSSQDLSSIDGFKDEIFNFAFAKRKDKLTGVEKIVKGFFVAIDAVVNTLGGSSSLAQSVANRIGVIMISSEYFSVTKKIWINSDGKQPQNYMDYLSASVIYNTYHKDRELAVNDGDVYDSMPIQCTQYEFTKFSRNKYVNLGNTGRVVELLEASYVDADAMAIVSFKDRKGTNNVVTKTVY